MANEELVQKYQNGDVNALDELIGDNSRIVYKIVNKYNGVNRELEEDDLYQSGLTGLIIAAKKYKFDIKNKAKFITYAVFFIDRYIQRCVNGNSQKEISNNEIYKKCTSLNISIGKDDDREIGDLIEDIDYGFENIEEKVFFNKLRNELEDVMRVENTLQEREVLKFKYGWNTKQYTLKEIGDILGVTGERVRQIESRALRKLRNSKWAINNMNEFEDLGYINKFYLDIYKNRGIKI